MEPSEYMKEAEASHQRRLRARQETMRLAYQMRDHARQLPEMIAALESIVSHLEKKMAEDKSRRTA